MRADWPTAAAACFSGIDCGQRQPGHARDDRARGDEDDLTPITGGGDLVGQRIDAALIGAGRRRRDEAAAHLHHQPATRG